MHFKLHYMIVPHRKSVNKGNTDVAFLLKMKKLIICT